MARLRPDFASGKLTDVSISASVATLNSPQFSTLPVVANPDVVVISLDPYGVYGTPERATIVGHAAGSGTITVARGSDGPVTGLSTRTHNVAGVQEDWVIAVTDQDFVHATLTALSADDHPQYLTPARHQAAGVHTAAAINSDIFFPGFTILWPGHLDAHVPPVWLPCQGQRVSRTQYAALFAAISTTWGGGDGSTTFTLPPATVFLGAAGGVWGIGAPGDVTNHHHNNYFNTTQNNTGAYSHTHQFSPGVVTGGETQNHVHTGVLYGNQTSAGVNVDHQHHLDWLTPGGPTENDIHAHTVSGDTNTISATSGISVAPFYVLIHI